MQTAPSAVPLHTESIRIHSQKYQSIGSWVLLGDNEGCCFPKMHVPSKAASQVKPITVGRLFTLARYQTPPMHAYDNNKTSRMLQEIKSLTVIGSMVVDGVLSLF